MSVSEMGRGVVDESVESAELARTINGFHLEPRCRICRNDQVRTKVNDLLATGASYAMVLRAIRIRRPRPSAGTGLSAPDMDRICEIVVIPDVANVDALGAARAIRCGMGAEGRAAERIGSTIAEDLASMPQIPFGGT